jgi:putative glutamine amidotransferase
MTRSIKVGLSARFLHPVSQAPGILSKTVQYLEESAAHWVMSRDVMVFMIPSVDRDGLIHRSSIRLRDYARELDGLILQGGADVSPMSYGEAPLNPEWQGDRVRDEYELELVSEFVEANKPVLGICRGAQLINVAFGGTLYQDIPTQIPGTSVHRDDLAYDRHHHEILLQKNSGLGKLYPGRECATVNSIHHQAVKGLGRDLVVEATADEGRIIEAIRWRGRGYVFGVQWHPELQGRAHDGVLDSAPILDEFLAEVRRRV